MSLEHNQIKKNEDNDKVNPRLKKILLDVLGTEDISMDDSIEVIDSWDSMGHMEIMLALEQNYSFRIEIEEIMNLTSVRAIQNYLRGKGFV